MKIIKSKSCNKLKISKNEWMALGEKKGWNKKAQILEEEMEDMFGSDVKEYKDVFKEKSIFPGQILAHYSDKDILDAIKYLGEQNIAGFSGVQEDEVAGVLKNCEKYELIDILNWLESNKKPIEKSKKVPITDPIIHDLATPGIEEFTEASKKKSQKSPTEHGFMDECMEKNKDKDDPGAYCAAIVDKAKGTTDWREGPKKSSVAVFQHNMIRRLKI